MRQQVDRNNHKLVCRQILTCGEIFGQWRMCLVTKLSRLFTPLDAHKFKLLHVTVDMVFQGWLFLMRSITATLD